MSSKGYFDFARYGSIGISWVVSTSIYLYLGYKGGTYLDGKFESAPIFMLIGLVAGIGLSFASLMSEIVTLTKETSRKPPPKDDHAQDCEKSNSSTPGADRQRGDEDLG